MASKKEKATRNWSRAAKGGGAVARLINAEPGKSKKQKQAAMKQAGVGLPRKSRAVGADVKEMRRLIRSEPGKTRAQKAANIKEAGLGGGG